MICSVSAAGAVLSRESSMVSAAVVALGRAPLKT